MEMKKLSHGDLLEVDADRRRRFLAVFMQGSEGSSRAPRQGPVGALIGGAILGLMICVGVAMVVLVQLDSARVSAPANPPPAASPKAP